MPENLRDPAAAQYDDWTGTFAADQVNFLPLEHFLGVNPEEWRLIVVDIHVAGGYQSITAYALPRDVWTYYNLRDTILDTGRIEVTRVVDWSEEPAEHDDTNPPPPLSLPVTWASELIALGFKRLNIRITNIPRELQEEAYEIIEVASIVDEE